MTANRPTDPDVRPAREPAFNAPGVVVATLGLLVLVHLARAFLSEDQDLEILLRFAFIPGRYDPGFAYAGDLLGGAGATVWTFVTYAALHGSWTHLAVNGVWLLAFGSALAWRFGASRFLAFSLATAAAGAATHLAFHYGQATPVVGASAAISGHMAAAMRFMFEAGGPLGMFRRPGQAAFRQPAEPLLVSLRRPQVIAFVAVWFAANLLFGLGAVSVAGEDANVAWEAHIGGFVAGILLFAVFDPSPRRPAGPGEVLNRGDLPHPSGSAHDGDAGADDRR